jgi:hypothetical protein
MRAALFSALALLAAPSAGSAAAARPALPNWNGVWERVGAITFDPTLKAGQIDSPPYKGDYAARWSAILAAERAGKPAADPSARCLPPGMPRVMNMVLPMEIIMIPGQVTVVAEWMGLVRRIYTDGRPHPADLDPTFNGHSTGRWSKGQLVVETVGLRGDTVFNAAGAPHSDAMTVKERYWQPAQNTLKIEITVDDPKAFTHPWTVLKTFTRRPGWEIQEYVCEENNRNPVDEHGLTGILLQDGAK